MKNMQKSVLTLITFVPYVFPHGINNAITLKRFVTLLQAPHWGTAVATRDRDA
jgi:hypothetical protein